MFSGIVEEVGRVAEYNPSNGALVIAASRVLVGDDGLRSSRQRLRQWRMPHSYRHHAQYLPRRHLSRDKALNLVH